MSDAHRSRVEAIAAQVRARPPGKRLTIRKARAGHTPHDLSYKRGRHPVDVGGLDQVLALDTAAKTVDVQAQVTLGQLCRATLPHGLMPPVVPEFETFTVAGLINGLGIETSSHRHGIFPAALLDFELVLGNGEVIRVDAEHHSELMEVLPGSYGTLGIVTRATLRLIDAEPWVRSRYRRFDDVDSYVDAFSAALEAHNFVEGIILARDHYVLITGDYSPAVDGLPVFEAMRHGQPWYYQHAAAQAEARAEDLVASYEYMFRHQRSAMWMAGIIADLSVFSDTRRGRAYLDREVERKIAAEGFKMNMPTELLERCLVNQDMVVRLSRLKEGIRYVQDNLGVYPLWNCPARMTDLPYLFAVNRQLVDTGERVAVDIGVYGEPTVKPYRNVDAMRALQRFVDVPAMWGVSYLTPEELGDIYDLKRYEAVKRAYHAEGVFVDLMDKIRFIHDDGRRQGKIPLWRLHRVWWDVKARLKGKKRR